MADAPEQQDVGGDSGGSGKGRIIAAGFMGLVILVECAVAYMFVPGPNDMIAKAKAMAADEIKQEEDEKKDQKEKEETTEEVELGRFNVAWHIPAAEQTLRADFELIGIVTTKKKAAFQSVFDNNKGRLRALIIFEIRNSTSEELSDSGLGLIKRRILEKSNALFGEPFLMDLAFSKYSFLPE